MLENNSHKSYQWFWQKNKSYNVNYSLLIMALSYIFNPQLHTKKASMLVLQALHEHKHIQYKCNWAIRTQDGSHEWATCFTTLLLVKHTSRLGGIHTFNKLKVLLVITVVQHMHWVALCSKLVTVCYTVLYTMSWSIWWHTHRVGHLLVDNR